MGKRPIDVDLNFDATTPLNKWWSLIKGNLSTLASFFTSKVDEDEVTEVSDPGKIVRLDENGKLNSMLFSDICPEHICPPSLEGGSITFCDPSKSPGHSISVDICGDLACRNLFVRNETNDEFSALTVRGRGIEQIYSAAFISGIKCTNQSYIDNLTFTQGSDERLKTKIEPADLKVCCDTILKIPLHYFEWKEEYFDDKIKPDRHQVGWIAQELESILPKTVREGTITLSDGQILRGAKSIDKEQLYALAFGALQKALMEIDQLKEEVRILKGGDVNG